MKHYYKYIKSFELGLQNSIEYRSNFLISLISIVFPIIIQYFLWSAIFNASPNSKLYGYSYNELIAYTFISGIVSKLVASGFEWEIADDIKNGGLNKFIIKPIGYFQYKLSCFFGQKTFQSLILLFLLSIILLFLKIILGLNLEISRILIFIVAIILATILNFLIFYGVSSLAFWLGDIGGLFIITSLIINIISGGVFPIEIFGNKIIKIINFLPFKYTIYFPINVINGKLPSNEILHGLLIQLIWIPIMFIFVKLLWNEGEKKYISIGG